MSVVLAFCRRAWWRNWCCASCFAEGETEAGSRDGVGMVVWVQPWAGPLSPPFPCIVLQRRQDLHRWKLLSACERHVAGEAFHVVFPRLCQGKGWGWREEGFCCRCSRALTAGFPLAVCMTLLQEVHDWNDININPVLLEYTYRSDFWHFLVIGERVDEVKDS